MKRAFMLAGRGVGVVSSVYNFHDTVPERSHPLAAAHAPEASRPFPSIHTPPSGGNQEISDATPRPTARGPAPRCPHSAVAGRPGSSRYELARRGAERERAERER